MKMRKKFRRGFTLVELVVVIAVIAILSAVSVGAYFGITDSANSSNATQGIKQIQKLWTMYSVSDYDSNLSAEERAVDFCLRYAVINGPDYEVNYAKVAVEKSNPGNGLAKNISRAYGDEASNDAILFKVETTYPTWFIVSGQHIIEESSTMIKNNKDFKVSLFESERLSDSTITQEQVDNDSYEFPFAISTLGKDSEGKNVRGFGFYKIDASFVDAKENALKPGSETFIVEKGTILADLDARFNVAQSVHTGSNNSFTGNLLKVYKTGDKTDEVDTASPLELDSKVIDRETDRISNLSDYTDKSNKVKFPKYSYVINEDFEITSQLLTASDLNLENYPVALVKFKYGGYTKTNSDTTYGYEIINEKSRDIVIAIQRQYEYIGYKYENEYFTANSFEINYYLFTNLGDAKAKIAEDPDFTYFLFLNNYTIKEDVSIPSNVLVVIDYNTEINDLLLYIKGSFPDSYVNSKIYTSTNSDWTDWSAGLLTDNTPKEKDIKKLTYDTYVEKLGLDPENSVNFTRFDTSRLFDAKIFYKNASTKEKTIDNVKIDGCKNVLTINSDVTVTFDEDSYLFIEGEVYAAGNGAPLGVGDHGKIVNNGEIILNKAKMRALAEVSGEGIITANNSEVIELFKPNDYKGGSHTANTIMIDSNTKRPIFPFNDYHCDSIKSELYINHGSSLSALTVLNLNGFYVPEPIVLLSDRDSSLFTTSFGSHIVKSYDSAQRRINLDIYGDVTDSEFKMSMDYSFVKEIVKDKLGDSLASLGAGFVNNLIRTKFPSNISSKDYNFAVSNMNVNVKPDANLIFDVPGTRYELLPTSSINVEGTVHVKNGANIIVVSPDDYNLMLNGKTVYNETTQQDEVVFNKYEFGGDTSMKPEIEKFAGMMSYDENGNPSSYIINIKSGGTFNVGSYTYGEENVITGYDVDSQLYINDNQYINCDPSGEFNISSAQASQSFYEYKVVTASQSITIYALGAKVNGDFQYEIYNVKNYRNA